MCLHNIMILKKRTLIKYMVNIEYESCLSSSLQGFEFRICVLNSFYSNRLEFRKN